MNIRIHLFTFLLAALATHAPAASSGFKELFNGKDLTGWEGNQEFWSVRDGAITGQTTGAKVLDANTFLIWKGGEPADFELRVMFRLVGNNEKNQANSGIQYRSRVLDPAGYVVGGYQADIDMGRYIGMLYEEKGRGILMQPGQRIRISPLPAGAAAGRKKSKVETTATVTSPAELASTYKLGEWNEIVIIARGNRLLHFLNGKLTADVVDDDAANRAMSGVIALQLHKGPPMTVQFKNLRMRPLR